MCPVATARPSRSALAAARLCARARASTPAPGATGPATSWCGTPSSRGQLAAGRGVGVALLSAQAVCDVQRLDRMPERDQGMGQERGVGAARDEREHGLPGLEQARAGDRRADARDQPVVERHPAASRPA